MPNKQPRVVAWVVYRMNQDGPAGPNAVCEQAEWDAMERASPGRRTLIQSGITSEQEAERLARGSPGGAAPGAVRLMARQP